MISETQEAWQNFRFAGGTSGEVCPKGVLHRLYLNPSHSGHFVWIAAGAFRQQAVGDTWYVQGILRFWLNHEIRGQYTFGDADPTAAIVYATPLRPITRIRADGSGSVQPILRYQETQAGISRDNLDIACFFYRERADFVEYVVDDSRFTAITVAPEVISIRLGFKIVSV